MADLSNISTEDLMAYKEGRLKDVSTEGLMALHTTVGTKEKPPEISTAKAALYGGAQGANFDTTDEMTAGIMSLGGGKYSDYIEPVRQQFDEAANQHPVAYYAGMLGGGALTGAGASSALKTIGGEALVRFIQTHPKLATSAIGGLSSGLFSAGAGDGSIQERASNAGLPALAGATLAVPTATVIEKAGIPLINATFGLAKKATNLFKSKAPQIGKDLTEFVAEQAPQVSETVSSKITALNKVITKLKQDFPDTWESVLESWKNSDKPLAELYGSRMTDLAKGAAQYPSGKAEADKYFTQQIAGMPDRATASLPENVYQGVDDIVNAGQAKAAPLYEKAYQDTAKEVWTGKLNPEVNSAIKLARALYPSELQGYPDNSVKVMDYAKRVIDDQIEKAKRAGLRNFIRSRTNIKNELLKSLDEASPAYKEARGVAGDYLSIEQAMNDGLDLFKTKPEEITKRLTQMSPAEKEAYKNGALQKVREIIGERNANRNPYDAILGAPNDKTRLMKVLSPTEYTNLEKTLQAENRLFKMRNEVLGGSPTTSKVIATGEIAQGGEEALTALATGGPRAAGLSTINKVIKSVFTGMNDKVAGQVSKLMYETDPQKKLLILDRMTRGRLLNQQEKHMVKQAYFQLEEIIRNRTIGANIGGMAASGLFGEQ